MRMRTLCGVVASIALLLLPGQSVAANADEIGALHLLYAFDECGDGDGDGCARVVRDSSGHANHGMVRGTKGGRLVVAPGWSGSGVRAKGATIRLENTADAALEPRRKSFSFGALVKMDRPTGAGANLLQRGRFSAETDQWKLQLDEGRQGCVVKGDRGRVFATAPEDLPVDGRWHAVACIVTPAFVAYVADSQVYLSPNTAGSISFAKTELVHVAGVVNDNGAINDAFPDPIDDVFFAS